MNKLLNLLDNLTTLFAALLPVLIIFFIWNRDSVVLNILLTDLVLTLTFLGIYQLLKRADERS